ncbi:MAG TPA: GNAT family N-acetyltransferase [Gaiellaceae bacterium]|nr:GNAT family N-acetyltransferase [Gaiellaceae bacterium]
METSIRTARADDAAAAADFAVAKRAEYEAYSPVFWRPAPTARAKHEPFLRFCIESGDFAALAAERDGTTAGIALANRRGAPPPFHADREATWFVDDFFVASPDLWQQVGGELLAEVERQASANGAERLIVVTAHGDGPKCAFLASAGFEPAASWWVHPVTPTAGPPPDLGTMQAVTGAAPRVYEPGGLTALAVSLGDEDPSSAVELFDRWAAASNAALAIVPARTSDAQLARALEEHGYAMASAWFSRAL